MSAWESIGKSDEWYTPPEVFHALGEIFDLDVAHPAGVITHVPCSAFLSDGALQRPWSGFVWMNPPFGGRNSLAPWLARFFDHGNGIALTPDRTSAPWWQDAAARADAGDRGPQALVGCPPRPPGPDRWKFRSRTFEGVAAACASQWAGTAQEAAA